AVARAAGGVVAPQRLDRELRAVIAGDVAHRAGDRLDVRLTGQTRDQRLADPRALVAVLVGVDRVVPAAEVGRAAADDVLCARIGDRLLDLVTQDDRLAVELAGGAAVDGVLAADIRAAGVDRQDVRHVRVREVRLNRVVGAVLDAWLRVVVEGAVALRQRVRVTQAGRLR